MDRDTERELDSKKRAKKNKKKLSHDLITQ